MAKALALALAILATACGDARRNQLRALKTELCRCETLSCGADVLKRVPQDDPRADHEARKIANEMLDCFARLKETARPTTDPDDPRAAIPATSPGSAVPVSGGTP